MKLNRVTCLICFVLTGLPQTHALGAGDTNIPAVVAEVHADTNDVPGCRTVSHYTANPIPTGSNCLTSAVFLKTLEAFYLQLATRAYENSPSRSEKWDKDVSSLISAYAKQASGEHRRNLTGFFEEQPLNNAEINMLKESLKRSDEILAKGCVDPFVEYMRAVLYYRLERRAEGIARIREIKQRMEDKKYAPIYLLMATRKLKSMLKDPRLMEKPSRSDESMMRYLGESAGDPLFKSNGFQRCFMEYIPTEFNHVSLEYCLSAIPTNGAADPWIKAVVSGNCHIERAWKLRGDGWAGEVTEEGWKGFSDELKQARQDLRTAQGMHPEFPDAASKMIVVSMGGGDEDSPRQWFDRAVAAQMDFPAAYDNFLWTLYPRWGGSNEEMFHFGVECMNTMRTDTHVSFQFLVILDKILNETSDIKPFCHEPGVFEGMEKFIREVMPKYNVDNSLLRSKMVLVGWAAGHDEEARRYFKELNGRFKNIAIDSLSIDPVTVLGEIHMPEGAQKERYREGDTLMESKSYEKAYAIFKELHDSGFAKDGPAATLLSSRLATTGLGAGMSKGEWSPLTGKDRMACWINRGGNWEFDSSGALRATQQANELFALCRLPMPDDYEIEGDLQAGCRAGLVLGLKKYLNREEFACVLLNSKQNTITVGTSFVYNYQTATTAHDIDPALKDQNHFLMRVQDGKITVSINSVKLFTYDGATNVWWSPHGGFIGVGGIPSGTTNDFAIYRNLRIRSLIADQDKSPKTANND